MTTLYHSETKQHWDSKILEIEEKTFKAQEAKQLHKEGKLKDGEIFAVSDGFFPSKPQQEVWVIGAFINGTFVFVRHSADDARITRLKRMAVAHIMDIIKRRWIDTRQAPWLTKKLQNIDDPTKVLYSATSMSDIDDNGKFTPDKKIMGEDEAMDL